MAKFTFFELHVDDASFSADKPFSSITDTDTEESAPDGESTPGGESAPDEGFTESDEPAVAVGESDDDGQSGSAVPTRLVTLGVLFALVAVVAAVRRLIGGEDPDVEVETPEDDDRPVGVTVDD